MGIIAAVAVLVIIAVLVLQIPGITPVPPPPTNVTGGPQINITPDVVDHLGPGSAILTNPIAKVSGGIITELVTQVYYIGGRSVNDICTEGGVAVRICETTISQGEKCTTPVEFTCSSTRVNDLQDTMTLGVNVNAAKSYRVLLEKYGTSANVVTG